MMGSNSDRGSTIVVALLITVVMLTLALTLLGQRVTQRRVVNARFLTAQSKALAWAGLEDARVKLMKSRDFPPNAAFEGASFSYSDTLTDESGTLVGAYFVEVDLRNQGKAIVRSTARLDGQEEPQIMLRGELDVLPSREAYTDLSGTTGVESRSFLWMKVEIFDVQASKN